MPPGAGGSREFLLVLSVADNASPTLVSFQVEARSVARETSGSVSASLEILPAGVAASLTPGLAQPGGTLSLVVTNTGFNAETNDLSLAGPGAFVAKLARTSVTLAPGESISIPISTTPIDFALAGPRVPAEAVIGSTPTMTLRPNSVPTILERRSIRNISATRVDETSG